MYVKYCVVASSWRTRLSKCVCVCAYVCCFVCCARSRACVCECVLRSALRLCCVVLSRPTDRPTYTPDFSYGRSIQLHTSRSVRHRRTRNHRRPYTHTRTIYVARTHTREPQPPHTRTGLVRASRKPHSLYTLDTAARARAHTHNPNRSAH